MASISGSANPRIKSCGVLCWLALSGCHSEPLSTLDGTRVPLPEPRSLALLDAVHISSSPDAQYHQQATVAVDFGRDSVSSATLRVELESPCYPFEKWSSEDIPAGQNWPRTCDAFDRGVLVTLDDPADPAAGPPALELARAITPFGGPEVFEADVTDVVNGLPGQHAFRIEIGTYADPEGQVSGSAGEWIVSATLLLEPGPAPRRVLAVVPLMFGVETDPEPPPVSFETPSGTRTARIEYRATGHGGAPFALGCRGPAEEFCPRNHALSLDGQVLEQFVPWRSDCQSLCTLAHHDASVILGDFDYCAENPCGALDSVRAPRANWCPGSPVAPHVLQAPELAVPGSHAFAAAIDSIADGGLWQISASYFAFE